MFLHEAIEKLLQQIGRPMTAREIADGLNKAKWYTKKDKSQIKPNQIIARVDDHHELFDIDRSFSPLQIKLFNWNLKHIAKTVAPQTEKIIIKKSLADLKKSFDPISDLETSILVLGTMPGDKSIELNEYYRHPRNRFWKIISTITNNTLPVTYPDKKALLLKTKIGIWDVARKANRKGSLDSAIGNEAPNDLDDFISKHKNLKVIGFNGAKSETLFDKYFARKKELRYILLPSTSPANLSIGFDNICKIWQQIIK